MNRVTRSLESNPRFRRLSRRAQMLRALLSVASAIAAVWIVDPAWAEVPNARSALAAGDCKAAGDAINEGLGRNDAEAFFLAGLLYDQGSCVTPDPTRAARLYLHAIDLGDTNAPQYLGMLHGLGRGVPQDYAMAHLFFHGGKPAAGDANASPSELIALGYVETITRMAQGQVSYPTTANSNGIEGNLDVILTPASGKIDFAAVHVGTEIGSNIPRTHDFTDRIEEAYRGAIGNAPRPQLSADSSIRVDTPWKFTMPRAVNNQKTRLEGIVSPGESRLVR